ncbi:MAG: DNA-binding response regulator [Elusimicrobia bacterium]|nr:MAG: DNA-binding response regulator [Elusimicrobiota bacterium]
MTEPSKETILIVEDDPAIRHMLRDSLAIDGFRVIESDSAERGFQLFVTREPDLVVLDVQLPDGSGFDVCRKIRASSGKSKTPIMMLTAQGHLESKITGLSAGADQYLVKPVHPLEFMQWVKALLRRVEFESGGGTKLVLGELTLMVETREAWFESMPLSRLTPKEFELLHYLVKHRDRVVSRKEILSKLWKTVAVDHTVDTHVRNLRKKLPTVISDRIQNVRGRGFHYFYD